MALDTQHYLVTKDIAIRSGLMQSRYRIADGRFALDNKDLSRVRFTTDEYISGLQGVEKVTEEEAETLIALNGYQMGEETEQPQQQETSEQVENGQQAEEEEPAAQEEGSEQGNQEVTEENNEETSGEHPSEEQPSEESELEEITGEDVGDVADILGGSQENNENTEE